MSDDLSRRRQDRSTRDEQGRFTGSMPLPIQSSSPPLPDKSSIPSGGSPPSPSGSPSPSSGSPAPSGSTPLTSGVNSRQDVETGILNRILQTDLPLFERFVRVQERFIGAQEELVRSQVADKRRTTRGSSTKKRLAVPESKPNPLKGCGADWRGRNFSGGNHPRSTLTHACLQDAIFEKANLEESDFSEAQLQKAKMSGAYLGRAILTGAKLQGADLTNTHLPEAKLQRVDLSGALLMYANLRSADLSEANLSKAKLQFAKLDEETRFFMTQMQDALIDPAHESIIEQWNFVTLPKGTLHFDRASLRQKLEDHFDKDELDMLCFDLNIEHENLPDTKDGCARELIAYCERHGLILELARKLLQLRPRVDWARYTSK